VLDPKKRLERKMKRSGIPLGSDFGKTSRILDLGTEQTRGRKKLVVSKETSARISSPKETKGRKSLPHSSPSIVKDRARRADH